MDKKTSPVTQLVYLDNCINQQAMNNNLPGCKRHFWTFMTLNRLITLKLNLINYGIFYSLVI